MDQNFSGDDASPPLGLKGVSGDTRRDPQARALLEEDVPVAGDSGQAAAAKGDSAEVYVGEEFISVLLRDDEDEDETAYQFQMAIVDYDLQ